MKKMSLIIFTLFLLNTNAQAKTTTIEGKDARSIMEAIVASELAVVSDDDWSHPISVNTASITCEYTNRLPDGWMSHARCVSGTDINSSPELKNSLALAKAIDRYSVSEGACGHIYLELKSINCTLINEIKEYICNIETEE